MPTKKKFTSHEEYLNWYRLYRKKNLKKLRKYNRIYNKKWRKENGYRNEENSKERYPEKLAARVILLAAISRGEIKRGKCKVCKKQNAQAHHPDYTKPLMVVWLCPLHHKNVHKKILHVDNSVD